MKNKKTDKKVNINKISYGILCLVMGFLFVFYLDSITFTLLLLAIVAPFASFGLCRYGVKNIEVKMLFKDRQIKQDGKAVLNVGVVNNCWLPLSNVYVVITVKNSFDDKEEEYVINYYVMGKKESFVELEIESGSCCHITAQCKGFYMYDYMEMYKSALVKTEHSDECYVFPRKEEIHFDSALGQEDDENGERDIKGEDVSEVADVREFRPGDRMSRIHWKLTTKCDEIMVKEYDLEYGNKMIIGFDLWSEGEYEKFDKILVVAYNVGRMLIENGRTFSYKWYDGNIDEYKEAEVSDIDGCDIAFKYILESKPVKSKEMFYYNEKEVNSQKFLYIAEKSALEFANGEIVGEIDGEVVLLWV